MTPDRRLQHTHGLLLQNTHKNLASVARVLIFRTGYLGDTVVALPALRLIAKSFPNAERRVLTQFNEYHRKAAPLAEVLAGTGLVHSYIQYPYGTRNLTGLMRLRRSIRDYRPDVLVYLAPAVGTRLKVWRDALFFRCCGVREFVGIPYTANLRQWQRLDNGLFEYEGARLLRCLRDLGEISLDANHAFDLCLTLEERTLGKATLKALPQDAPVLAVSVGAKVDVKDWGDLKWSALLSELSGLLRGWSLVMIGAAVDHHRSQQLMRFWNGAALNLCGKVSVRISAAVIEQARLFVGHDSGPMHLAAAAGTLCIAIFSSRRLPGVWFPWGRSHRVIYTNVPCQNCNLDVCTRQAKMCIESIAVDDVIREIRSALGPEIGETGVQPTQRTAEPQ